MRSVEADLVVPRVTDSAPAPGARVRMTAREYAGTDVHHALYLPTDWQPGARYPVIVEYAGNGPFTNAFGDTCSGTLDDCCLGYGISGGEGFLWLCLPFVAPGGDRNERDRWADHEWYDACVAFCAEWDQNCFDPDYRSKPLEHFEPLVRDLFAEARQDFS